MTLARIYIWQPDVKDFTGGFLELATMPLSHLDPAAVNEIRLSGRYVEVVNVGEINVPADEPGGFVAQAIGNAEPDENGNFFFSPGKGGGRLDKVDIAEPDKRARYIATSHFGEVNAYYHVTRIAEYVDRLLMRLGEKPLPRVRVLVNAHHAATERDGLRDGVRGKKSGKWLPFQGGHYCLTTRRQSPIPEYLHVWPTGEIHLGPGWRLTRDSWLPMVAGHAYRCNASHNAGIIYHEYGHHITRHTADFLANLFKAPHRQSNRKTASDEGVSDYWAATMLGTPHIWCWHRRHDSDSIHPRSLASQVSMSDFDNRQDADSHQNGTILGAALWDLRQTMEQKGEPASACDLLVLAALLNIGRLRDDPYRPSVRGTRRLRESFHTFAACLHYADACLFDNRHEQLIRAILEKRGIKPCSYTLSRLKGSTVPPPCGSLANDPPTRKAVAKIRQRVPDAIIPEDIELLHPDKLDEHLRGTGDGPYDLVAVGEVMLGSHARRPIREYGPEYPFAWVAPIFRRAAIILGNLEGPFSRDAKRRLRNFPYKVNPKNARILRRAGFRVMTLANNHLLDCGRNGVIETIETLVQQGIEPIGAGQNKAAAHKPAVLRARAYRIGILGYYWNRRTSARGSLPGSARDLPDMVEHDISLLSRRTDLVIVTVHWGVPYDRLPSKDDRLKARHFIDCGADMVIGHHPHIIQPFEIYQGRPIFYSIGNFVFGSGNSRAESLLLGIRFEDGAIEVDVFPVYVKNRDPRVDYQPKVMSGGAASRTLRQLTSLSGSAGDRLEINDFFGRLRVPVAINLQVES